MKSVGAADSASRGLLAVRQKIAEWNVLRAELRAIEEVEHPPFHDKYGRVWTWVSGDLWHHDNTLAYPRDMIDDLCLPSETLRTNPNYWQLCEICRNHWIDNSPVSPRCQLSGGQWFDVRDGKFYASA